ncbi:Nn.00g015090.m01.CDS01 [Neocucurbitaria sp. VM-36]
MPFRDEAWENLQRDCAIFPAYTDYLFGPDLRPEAIEEPGLHPLLFPPQSHAPIRYTNSRPSRTWSYNSTQGTARPKLAVMGPQFGDGAEMAGVELSRENSSSNPSLDVRSPVESPMSKLLPPQSIYPNSAAEMARRRMCDAAQRRTSIMSPTASDSLTNLFQAFRQQAQTQDGLLPFSVTAGRASNPPLLRSSSATDVDEQVAHIATQKVPMPSSPESPPAMASCSAQPHWRQSQPTSGFVNQIPNVNSGFSPNLPSLALQNPTPHNSSTHMPLIQPNDLSENPRYVFFADKDRQEINKQITARWNTAHNHPDPDARAQAILDIQRVSQTIYSAGEMYGRETRRTMEMKEQLRAQAGHQYYEPRSDNFAQPPQLAASPQSGQQNQLRSAVQRIAPQSSQRHLSPMQQAPSQISQELRTNIDAHLPKLFQCLQTASGHSSSSPSLPSEGAAEKKYAQQWLESFKASLPPEGRQYVQHLAARVLMAKVELRDAMQYLVW